MAIEKIEKYLKILLQTNPISLERSVRGFLVYFHYHISNKNILKIVSKGDENKSIVCVTPTIFKGNGSIVVTTSTTFGYVQSPGSFESSYIEARNIDTKVEIGFDVIINNRAVICAEGPGVKIGNNCLIGPDIFITDSNGHELHVPDRRLPDKKPKMVIVGNDVFIGAKVIILKGVNIGDGSVVAAGAVLQPGFSAPPMSIISGNPAKIVGNVKCV